MFRRTTKSNRNLPPGLTDNPTNRINARAAASKAANASKLTSVSRVAPRGLGAAGSAAKGMMSRLASLKPATASLKPATTIFKKGGGVKKAKKK